MPLSDAQKWAASVELAKNQIGDNRNISDRELRDTIDNIYTNTYGGQDVNKFHTQPNVISMGKDAADGFDDFIGSVLDGVFDTVVGGGADLVMGKEAGDIARNLVNENNRSLIGGIASDIALSAIPGIGLPMVVAKNAAQQSGNLNEAISGLDNITNEKLSGGQRLERGLEAIGSTALSAIPGIGKFRAGKEAFTKADDVAKAGVKTAEEASDNAAKALSGAQKQLDDSYELMKSLTPGTKDYNAAAALKQEASQGVKMAKADVSAASDDLAKAQSEVGRTFLDRVKTGVPENAKSIPDNIKSSLKDRAGTDRGSDSLNNFHPIKRAEQLRNEAKDDELNKMVVDALRESDPKAASKFENDLRRQANSTATKDFAHAVNPFGYVRDSVVETARGINPFNTLPVTPREILERNITEAAKDTAKLSPAQKVKYRKLSEPEKAEVAKYVGAGGNATKGFINGVGNFGVGMGVNTIDNMANGMPITEAAVPDPNNYDWMTLLAASMAPRRRLLGPSLAGKLAGTASGVSRYNAHQSRSDGGMTPEQIASILNIIQQEEEE